MYDGTLAEPSSSGVPSCPVCGSDDCRQFHPMPHPDDYPFLPGGYDDRAVAGPPEPVRQGARKGPGLRCRS